MVFREEPKIDTYLCVQRVAEPTTVVIQAVLENDDRNRHDAVLRRILDDGMVLQINPRCGEVKLYITAENLYVTMMLLGLPIGSRDVDGVGYVLKREVNTRFYPFRGIGYIRLTQEPIGKSEVIVPLQVVGTEMLQVRVRAHTLGIGSGTDEELVFAG